MAGSFQDELANTLRNGYCTIVDSYANFLEQNFPAFGVVPNPGLGAARLAQRLFCGSEPPDPPPPAFEGGQCAGVVYEWRSQGLVTNAQGGTAVVGSTTWNVGFFALAGPIVDGGVRIQPNNGGYNVFIRNTAGQEKVSAGGGAGANLVSAETYFFEVRRADGQPDNCGDPAAPPIDPPPPDYNVIDVDVIYTDNSGNDITVPINAIFAPVVIAGNGNVFAPVRVNIPVDLNLDINGTLNLTTGDINLNFGDQNRLPGIEDCPPPPPSVPDDIPDIPDDVPDYSEPDEPGAVPTVIRGCIVTVTETGNGVTHVFQGDNPDVYLPRLGNVQFQMEFGRQIAWSEDIPVKNRRQFIRCPWEGGAIAVEGTPSPGVSWTITPVYDFSDRVIDIIPFVD